MPYASYDRLIHRASDNAMELIDLGASRSGVLVVVAYARFVKRQIFKKPKAPPATSVPILPGQLPLFDVACGAPDPKAEAAAKAAILNTLLKYRGEFYAQIRAINTSVRLIERGIQMPDVAKALGLFPVIPASDRKIRAWKIRPNSNIAIVADMLEKAERKGVFEQEMVAELEGLGRLTTAVDKRRAVHWTVTELRRRTRYIGHEARRSGGRWYAYGVFDVWR